MLGAIKALLSIIDRMLSLFQEERLKEQGRKQALEEYRLRSIEAREKANEIEGLPPPNSKHDILDRL